MRKLIILAGMIVLLVGCTTPSPIPTTTPTASSTTIPTQIPVSSPSPSSGMCQDMTHVYNPSRLLVLSPCQHVTGIVEIIRIEADGDYHILVHVDPNQLDPTGGNWINSANTTYQHGDLVTEPVCEHAITQTDAVSVCAGYTNPTYVPKAGDHVEVSGPWVEDTAHFNWREIHPAVYTLLSAFSTGDNS